MTLDLQSRIDAADREELARQFCYATIDSPLFLGRAGEYFVRRLKETDAVTLALTVHFRVTDTWKLKP